LIAFIKSAQLSTSVIFSTLLEVAFASISSWIWIRILLILSPRLSSTLSYYLTPSFLLQHLVSPFSKSFDPISSLIGTPLYSQ
jgi:hypothetical protein